MNDLAGFAVIGAFFAVAFGSMMISGVLGAALVSLVPTIRRRGTPARRWLLIASTAGYGGGFAAVLAWGALRCGYPSFTSNATLPPMCWTSAAIVGAASRVIGSAVPGTDAATPEPTPESKPTIDSSRPGS